MPYSAASLLASWHGLPAAEQMFGFPTLSHELAPPLFCGPLASIPVLEIYMRPHASWHDAG